jgi:hypothetical protein
MDFSAGPEFGSIDWMMGNGEMWRRGNGEMWRRGNGETWIPRPTRRCRLGEGRHPALVRSSADVERLFRGDPSDSS